MLAPVTLQSSGLPNPRAMAQLIAANCLIYHNAVQEAQDCLDLLGGGEFIGGQFQPQSWPPSWSLLKLGDDYLLVFAGTTNARQIVLHVGGALGIHYTEPQFDGAPFAATVNVHPIWASVWATMKETIAPLLPMGEDGWRLTVTGHSYGGAVGLLAALWAARKIGPDRVSLLTFGQPKALTTNYDYQLPARMVRVKTDGDAIPSLGPLANYYLIPVNFGLKKLNSTLNPYGHYGKRVTLLASGDTTIDSEQESFFAFQPSALYNTATEETHYASNYLARIAKYWKDFYGNSQPEATILEIAKQALSLPGEQFENAVIHRNGYLSLADANFYYSNGSDPDYLTEETIGTVESIGITTDRVSIRPNTGPNRGVSAFFANIHDSGGFNMATSGLWKITLIINNGLHGRSQSVVHKGSDTLTQAIVVARQYAAKRAILLGSTHTVVGDQTKSQGEPRIEFIRVSDAKNLKVSQLIPLVETPVFGPAASESRAADRFSTALSFRLKGEDIADATRSSHANHLIVGQPDNIVTAGTYNGAYVHRAGNTFNADLKSYLEYLTGASNPLFGFLGTSAEEPKRIINRVVYNDSGKYQCRTEANHGYVTGDRVRLTEMNAKGFAGTHQVNRVSDTEFQINTLMVSGLPLPTYGKSQRIQNADGTKAETFFQFKTPEGGWNQPFGVKVSKANLGREFLGVSFRPRAK